MLTDEWRKMSEWRREMRAGYEVTAMELDEWEASEARFAANTRSGTGMSLHCDKVGRGWALRVTVTLGMQIVWGCSYSSRKLSSADLVGRGKERIAKLMHEGEANEA